MAEIDIFFVTYQKAPVARTRNLGMWINLDLDANGDPVAVEFINAGDGINLHDIPAAAEIELLAHGFGLPIAA